MLVVTQRVAESVQFALTERLSINYFMVSILIYLLSSPITQLKIEWWREYLTVSDVIEQSGVTERYLANAIISDKSK